MRSLHHFGVPGRERGNMIAIWKATRTKKKPVWKYAFFQQGCRTCPLCIFSKKERHGKYQILFLHERNIGQSVNLVHIVKRDHFRNVTPSFWALPPLPQFWILFYEVCEVDRNRSNSFQMQRFLIISKLPSSSDQSSNVWNDLCFFWWGPAETDQQPTEKQHIFRTWKSQQQNLPSTCVSNLLLANPTFGPFAGAPKEMGIEGPLLINATKTKSVESATGGPVEVAVQKNRGRCWKPWLLGEVVVAGCSLCWIQEAHDLDGGKRGFSGWLDFWQWLYPWCPPLILGMQLPGIISIHQAMPPRHEATRIP